MIHPRISVIVCTYNEAGFLKDCMSRVIAQSFSDFELIVLDDGSRDNTADIVASCCDNRIKYFKQSVNSGSMGKIRALAVEKACGEYIFFTDADCLPTKNWLEEGLKFFQQTGATAIEGKVIYNKEGYRPTLSDRTVDNISGGEWKTANMAFKRSLFNEFSFNPSYPELEDRELALRIKRKYRIPFAPECMVYHQKKTMGVRSFLKLCTIGIQKVRLIKEQNDSLGNRYGIFDMSSLRIMLFPPFILAKIFHGRVKSWPDVKLLFFLWPAAVYTRFLVWKTAIKEKVLVI